MDYGINTVLTNFYFMYVVLPNNYCGNNYIIHTLTNLISTLGKLQTGLANAIVQQ